LRKARTARATLPLFSLALTTLAGCFSDPTDGVQRTDDMPRSAVSPRLEARAATTAPEPASLATLGDGFAVWESNRSGSWRIWLRHFSQPGPEPLSPEEASGTHCCAHIAPGGQRVAYLSQPADQPPYREPGALGTLHLVRTDGSDDRILMPRARTYFEHRAAVWRSDHELIAIDGDGRTRLLTLDHEENADPTVEQTVLVPDVVPGARGWLLDATLRHATTGAPGFATYDAEHRRILAAPPLAGCQPYFTHDGRFGFWMAGAGGPIRRLDLASDQQATILAKSDPRLPGDRGYLYFPMISSDSRLLAWAASDGAHDHETSDYDVFVAEIDPDTLDLLGPPLRVTRDPAVDRFPDVFLAELALGRLRGEAPFTVVFEAPIEGAWQWRIQPATRADAGAEILSKTSARTLRHTFTEPGRYRVQARSGTQILGGLVRVQPARAPSVLAAEITAARAVTVRFDEPVTPDGAEIAFASGRKITGSTLAANGRSLLLALAEPITEDDTLRLAGVRDRAAVANTLAPVQMLVAAPTWPAKRDGLVFLWQSVAATNQVETPAALGRRRTTLEASGRAYTDRSGAMVLAGGHFLADGPTMEGVLAGCRASNQIAIEATLTPAVEPVSSAGTGPGRILSFSSGAGRRNLNLSQVGDELVLQINTPETLDASEPGQSLGRLPRGRTSHVLIAYEPGRLRYFRDGKLERDLSLATGGFFHWRLLPLLFGNEWQADRPWFGTVEGVALYNRVPTTREVRENARRYSALRSRRPTIARLVLQATLLARSRVPTLREIAPYRQALAIDAYRVVRVIEGVYAEDEVRVVRRALLDGERLPSVGDRPGTPITLRLEPFDAHPELESQYRADTLEARDDLPLYFAPGP